MYLYGIGVLLSLNFFQTCVFTTIFTYFNMIAVLVLIVVNFMGISESIRTKIVAGFYFLLFVWYVAIMSDLYITFKNWLEEILYSWIWNKWIDNKMNGKIMILYKFCNIYVNIIFETKNLSYHIFPLYRLILHHTLLFTYKFFCFFCTFL